MTHTVYKVKKIGAMGAVDRPVAHFVAAVAKPLLVIIEGSCAIRVSNFATNMLGLSSHNIIDRISTETDLSVEDQGPFCLNRNSH